MINFSTGNQNMINKTEIKKVLQYTIKNSDFYAYSSPKGLEELRLEIANMLNKRFGSNLTRKNIFITTGSQQSLFLITSVLKKFNNKNVTFTGYVETPTYDDAVHIFLNSGAKLKFYEVNQDGADLDKVSDLLKEKIPNFIYCVPNVSNPLGIVWQEKDKFLSLIDKKDCFVLEDDPYSCFAFEKISNPLFFSGDYENIVYLGTFSKLICPSLSVGYIVSKNEELIDALYLEKKLADLNTSLLLQNVVLNYIKHWGFDKAIEKKLTIYKKNLSFVLKILNDTFKCDKLAEYYVPAGGNFLAIRFKKDISKQLEDLSALHGYKFDKVGNYLNKNETIIRINYSVIDKNEFKTAIKILKGML